MPADQVKGLYDALWKLPGGGYDTHQIGGHPCPQQGPVELEVEQLRHGIEGLPFTWGDPADKVGRRRMAAPAPGCFR